MLGLGEAVVGVGEELVEMSVDCELACRGEAFGEVSPGEGTFEGVVHDDGEVRVCGGGFDGGEGVAGP